MDTNEFDIDEFIEFLKNNINNMGAIKYSRVWGIIDINFDKIFNQKNNLNSWENYIISNIYTRRNKTEEALTYLKLSADQDNYLAQYALGYIYEVGTFGVEKDESLAMNYYVLSAIQGYDDAEYNFHMLIEKPHSSPFMKKYNLTDMYIEVKKLENNYVSKIKELEAKIEELELEIKYKPGGKGYYEAEEDFNQNLNKKN